MINILYITNFQANLFYGGFINDYLNDLLYYGFTELEQVDIIETTPIICLYKNYQNNIDIKHLWGKGFSSSFLIDRDTKDRSSINNKVINKYYDYIVYGSCNRCLDNYETISKIYDASKIILVDGSDDTSVHPLHEKHTYFKRELVIKHKNILPIHFAIPESKITNTSISKTKMISDIIPGNAYSYDKEEHYYNEYQSSNFAITTKKAGWDCMRHYEILANKCIPIFKDLQNCPKQTLTVFPKTLIYEADQLMKNFDQKKYNILNDTIFTYTKQHLTTKKLANYILEKII